MVMQAVDKYLTVRRAAGYKLRNVEGYLRDFARFAQHSRREPRRGADRDNLGGTNALGSPTRFTLENGGPICALQPIRRPPA